MSTLAHGPAMSSTGKRRRWLLAVLAILALAMTTLGTTASPAEAATKKICAPSGKCKTVNTSSKNYCKPGASCRKEMFRKYTGYCSSSTGCITYKGKNYIYVGGPKLTSAQKNAARKCAASLGFAALTAPTTGGSSVFLIGLSITAWGCT
ncbi:hypothetical protein H9Y04_41675 [Streptomyces sp. TRM66268-LWL]|uniref:Uncharacterized protein n=1 Tax=Streptomyces polyasparticus TaxID=2767826 RepID=A0ABR7SVZ3_9ACTN|nr:hypothetical protein [Streptomyces polyasparticus]MBC9719054.1 hypothetical protein [Streptomyces polyasparticus]